MHVEIDDCHTLGPVEPLRLSRGDSYGVDEAEPHRAVALGVMPRRAGQNECIMHLAQNDRFDPPQHPAQRRRRRFKTA